jgi:hypothetical protein
MCYYAICAMQLIVIYSRLGDAEGSAGSEFVLSTFVDDEQRKQLATNLR